MRVIQHCICRPLHSTLFFSSSSTSTTSSKRLGPVWSRSLSHVTATTIRLFKAPTPPGKGDFYFLFFFPFVWLSRKQWKSKEKFDVMLVFNRASKWSSLQKPRLGDGVQEHVQVHFYCNPISSFFTQTPLLYLFFKTHL